MSTATLTHSSPFLVAVRDMFAGWFAATHTATPARPLTRFEEAEQLRAMADDVAKSDPAFAQDLYAAADRHELA
jgi:hypothetical protein